MAMIVGLHEAAAAGDARAASVLVKLPGEDTPGSEDREVTIVDDV